MSTPGRERVYLRIILPHTRLYNIIGRLLSHTSLPPNQPHPTSPVSPMNSPLKVTQPNSDHHKNVVTPNRSHLFQYQSRRNTLNRSKCVRHTNTIIGNPPPRNGRRHRDHYRYCLYVCLVIPHCLDITSLPPLQLLLCLKSHPNSFLSYTCGNPLICVCVCVC